MVGDSVTWSYGANNDTTYPLTFEKIYNQKHNKNQISVYNYGVPGYGIDQEYFLIQNKILKELKPDLIVWNININDIRDNNYMCLYRSQNNQWQKISATHNIGYWYGWLGANLPTSVTNSKLFNYTWQIFFRLITSTTNESLYTFGCSTVLRNPDTNKLIAKRLSYFVLQLQKQLEDTSSQLIITLVPYQNYFDHQFSPKDLDPDYFLIKNTLNDSGINFIDFNETILEKFRNKTNSPQLNFAQEYFLDDSIDRNPNGIRHPNQKMYDLMAKTLVDYLKQNQLTL
jgi:lysophospholipase L1-like esterase